MLRRGRFALPIVVSVVLVLVSLSNAHGQQVPANDPQKQFGSVSGSVLAADTGEPLRKVRLTLRNDDQTANHIWMAITDAGGQFSIDHIPPGRYNFFAERTGYLAQEFSQTDPDRAGAVFAISAGQKITGVVFHLRRMAVISGRVTDEDGDPVQGVPVFVLERRTSRKPAEPSYVNQANTDDLGRYRVFDLPPGHYLVRAQGQDQRERMMLEGEGLVIEGKVAGIVERATTYYPSTTDLGRAAVVDVKAGDEATGIDISLVPEVPHALFRIRGRVTVSAPKSEKLQIIVMALPRQDQTGQLDLEGRRQGLADQKTGQFEIRDVAPGAYRVMAFEAELERRASQDVDVVASDIDGVNLVLANGVDVFGKVQFEGAAASKGQNLVVRITPRDQEMFPFGGMAEVQADGTFVLKGVSPGSYSFQVTSDCRDCYAKAISVDGTDALEKGMEVSGGAGPSRIEVLYSSNTGIATGVVTGKDDMPVGGATVILVSDKDSTLDGDHSNRASTDQNGRFEMRGMPPGKYSAFAFEKVEADDLGDPDALQRVRKVADSVDISANQTVTMQLKLIPAASEPEQ